MLVSITLMFAIAAMTIIAFAIVSSKTTPILVGQRWRMPGVGIVRIIRVLGLGARFDENVGTDANVMFRLLTGQYGFCRKSEIQTAGQLLPFDIVPAQRLQGETKTQIEIDNVIEHLRRQTDLKLKVIRGDTEFKPYKPPPGWTGRIYDAEIVPNEPDNKSPKFKFLTFENKS